MHTYLIYLCVVSVSLVVTVMPLRWGWAALTTTWAPSLRLSFVPGSKDIGASLSGSLVSRSLVSVLLFRALFAMGLRVSGLDRWAPPNWTLCFGPLCFSSLVSGRSGFKNMAPCVFPRAVSETR